MKKYKLKIPETIRSTDGWLVDELLEDCSSSNSIYEQSWHVEPNGYTCVHAKLTESWYQVPDEWLEEIKPKSAFQEWEETTGPTTSVLQQRSRKEGWNGAIEEVKKRHPFIKVNFEPQGESTYGVDCDMTGILNDMMEE